MKPDYGLIMRSLTDVVAEPIRSVLIPGFADIKAEAVQQGALGSGISGSGPTIFALSTEYQIAENVGHAIARQFERIKLKSDVFVSRINGEGARVVDLETAPIAQEN
jgi:homoserine kinase